MRKKDETSEVFFEVIVGIILIGIIGMGLLSLVIKGPMYWSLFKISIVLGFGSGCVAACLMFSHIRRSLQVSMDIGEHGAKNHATKSYIIRTTAIAILLVITCYFQYLNTLAVFFGILSLKVAVYMRPFTHKLLGIIKGKEEEDELSYDSSQ